MSQADYVVSNGSGQAVRSDLNGQLAAIVSNNSGATAPATTYAYQWWADTTTGLLKIRNAANTAFVSVGTLASANLGLIPAGTAAIVNADVNASAAIASSKLAFTQSGTGAIARTVDAKLKDVVFVTDFGAVGDGTTDDTTAIQAAINSTSSKSVYFAPGTYRITSTISIPSRTSLICYGAAFTGSTGATPFFSISNGISIGIYGGEFYQITCSSFIKVTGNWTGASSYSRQLRFCDIWLESSLTGIGLDFFNGVRQAFISNCFFNCNNGFLFTNKIIEINITNCLLFVNAASTVGTYGVKITTTGNYANEGIFLDNCTVDFFEKGFIITDCFVFGINQGYYGGTAKAFEYNQPNTTGSGLSRHSFNGATINQGSTIGSFTGGQSLFFKWSNCNFTNNSITSLTFNGNAYEATVADCSFQSSSSAPYAVLMNNNSGAVKISGCTVDNTYTNAFGVSGASSLYANTIENNTYTGSGSTVSVNQRPTILRGNTIASATDGSQVMPYGQITPGAYTSGNTFFSMQRVIPKGQRGVFTGSVIATAATGGNLMTAIPPTGTEYPGGSGWSSVWTWIPTGTSMITFHIPFYTTVDLTTGTPFTIVAQGSFTVNSHSWAAVILD